MRDSTIAALVFGKSAASASRAASLIGHLKQVGFGNVELNPFLLGNIGAKELANVLGQEGLGVCGIHVEFESLRDKFDAVVADAQTLRCRCLGLGSGIPPNMRTAEGYRQFAKEAAEMGRRLADAGITLVYHNHAWELKRFDGRSGLEILYAESDPAYLKAELDPYFVQLVGDDPVAWIEKVKDRLPLFHLADLIKGPAGARMAAVGEGELNWSAILAAAKAASVQWYIIEQDADQDGAIESLARSLKNLKAMGIQ